jgi:hypothetical protein
MEREGVVYWTVTATWRVPIPVGMSIHWIRDRIRELHDACPKMLSVSPRMNWSIKQSDWTQHLWEQDYRP